MDRLYIRYAFIRQAPCQLFFINGGYSEYSCGAQIDTTLLKDQKRVLRQLSCPSAIFIDNFVLLIYYSRP